MQVRKSAVSASKCTINCLVAWLCHCLDALGAYSAPQKHSANLYGREGKLKVGSGRYGMQGGEIAPK